MRKERGLAAQDSVLAAVGILLTFLFGASIPAGAQQDNQSSATDAAKTPAFSADRQKRGSQQWAVVKRGSRTVFGIPSDAGGFSRYERARIIVEERLNKLFEMAPVTNPNNYVIRNINGEVAICLKNPGNVAELPNPAVILTIDRNFEQALKRNRWDIAYYWRDILIGRNLQQVQTKWMVVSQGVGVSGPGGAHSSSHRSYKRTRTHTPTDPAGRRQDDQNSWHMIPKGYSRNAGKGN